jgi:hypothetical protein
VIMTWQHSSGLAQIKTGQTFNDFLLEIARGNISGQSAVNKFGRNIEIDSGVTADVWDGGHTADESLLWVAPTQARTHTIASTSASDTDGGVGARRLLLFGLTDWDTTEVSEEIIMNTGSPPVTANSYVIIHRMRVTTKGATNVNVGVITATATSDATVTAKIRAGQGQTQMAVYGIPSTQKAYAGNFYGNVNKAGGAAGLIDISLKVNPEPQNELINFLVKHTFGLQTVGTSALEVNYYTPKEIPGPAIIKAQALSGTDNMDLSAGFDLVLVDN